MCRLRTGRGIGIVQVEMGQGRVRGPRGGKEFGLGKKKRRPDYRE